MYTQETLDRLVAAETIKKAAEEVAAEIRRKITDSIDQKAALEMLASKPLPLSDQVSLKTAGIRFSESGMGHAHLMQYLPQQTLQCCYKPSFSVSNIEALLAKNPACAAESAMVLTVLDRAKELEVQQQLADGKAVSLVVSTNKEDIEQAKEVLLAHLGGEEEPIERLVDRVVERKSPSASVYVED